MDKRFWSVLAAATLIASGFSVTSASAQDAAPVIPAEPNIVDPGGDANHHSALTGEATGVSLTGADILAVWFSNDATNVNVHVQTTTGARPSSFTFETYMDPGVGADCMSFDMITPGDGVAGETKLYLEGDCGDMYETVGEVLEAEGPDGTSILTGTIPREKAATLLIDGASLKAPHSLVGWTVPDVGRVTTIDDTATGTDYTITPPEPQTGEPPAVEPPVVEPDDPTDDPPKKNCKKIKNKKKRKKCKKRQAQQPPAPDPEPEPVACDAYAPGEKGAEAEMTVVTPEATEEAPIELELTPGPAIGLFSGELQPGVENPFITHEFHNVQVDTDGEPLGLYVRIEFPDGEDQDLYLLNADDSTAARAAGGNQAPEVLGDGTGTGGHSETIAEQLDGVLTPDCGGYTIDDVNAFGFGETIMKLWLGPATWDPVAQAAIGGGR